MKHNKILYGFLVASLFTGCMGGSNNLLGYRYNAPTTTTTSSSSVKKSLAFMYEEERLAKEVYLSIYKKQPVSQLYRIATNSETRHISAVESLARKYGVALSPQRVGRYRNSHIQSLYNTLYKKGIRSTKDALQVGCMVEVTDINDLNKYIYQAQRAGASDVVQTYEFLRRGSYNHYWAFDRGLKNIGVSSGCCSLGSKYCHNEYPQNQRGKGRGRGYGRGFGHGRGHEGGFGGGPWR